MISYAVSNTLVEYNTSQQINSVLKKRRSVEKAEKWQFSSHTYNSGNLQPIEMIFSIYKS